MNDLIPLPTQLVQAIGDYLARRPFLEVEGLIAGIRQAAAAQANATQGEAETDKQTAGG